MACWKPDRTWIDGVARRAGEYDLLSFDIFDTVLTRIVDSPVDAFAEVERRLGSEFGELARGFAQARESAEIDARIRHRAILGAEEIAFDDIYRQLAERYPDARDFLAAAKQQELDVESSVLVAVPDTALLIEELEKSERDFILVSDMYLPSVFLSSVLQRNGIRGWMQLYVSCEVQLTKHVGSIWRYLGSPSKKILHVGDDRWADVERPMASGVDTVLYSRAKSERRVGARLSPSSLPFSYAQRRAELNLRADPSRTVDDDRQRWGAIGEVLGTLMVGSYVRWLGDRVSKHRVDRLYFCARDGWLLQQAWRAAGFDKSTGIEDHYLLVARKPLNMACGFVEGHPRRLDQNLLRFLSLSDNTVTIARAIARAGLLHVTAIVDDARATFGDIESKTLDKETELLFHDLLQRHSEDVYSLCESFYVNLRGYLEQQGALSGGTIALADLGWNGSIQRSLRKIGRFVRPDHEVVGFYYGLWTSALKNRFSAGVMEAAFANEFLSESQQAGVMNALEVLEELHSAPHGSVDGHEQSREGWTARFATRQHELDQHDRATRYFQDGVIKGVKTVFGGGSHLGLTLDDMTLENARAAIDLVFLSPTASELNLLGSIGHCWAYDHASYEPIVSSEMPSDPKERDHALWSRGWRIGTLRSWHANSRGPAQSEVRQFARARLSSLGERVLRQFG